MKKSLFSDLTTIALASAVTLALGLQHTAGAANNAPAPNRAAELLPLGLAEKVLNAPCDAGNENVLADTKSGPTWVSKAFYQVKSNQPLAPQVGLLIRHVATPSEAENAFATQKAAQQGVDVNIQGATKAYRSKQPAQLNVLKGCNLLIITAGTVKSPDNYGQEKIAKEVLPKITD
ncbi:MAG: hypothetical protein JSS86_24585 [Cyanobacteria bacterium SZAS LIN-2]|nr:hypothetical protein [Cyanobacteria bacterium SZAS LIN-3]MBS1999535.1 hypothetical protein [Cyanobacteria bacterium SZAS LIN-2]MBS2010255.1 hypothetical protein [Cyanobacteria bacterium SZAS TMP-1]